MTTVKKLVFCSTCAMILMGTIPKTLADNTLKNDTQTTSTKKAFAGLLKDATAVGKTMVGTSFAWWCATSLEKMIKETIKDKQNVEFAKLIFAPIGTVTGTVIIASGIYDLYVSYRKKSERTKKLSELARNQ